MARIESELMNDKQKRNMIVHFNDGSKRLFEFPSPVADGALLVIPVESIKYLQSTPAPKKLPVYAIRGVRFKD